MKNTLLQLLITYIRRSIYFVLYVMDMLLGRYNNLFILSYHSINHDTWRFSVDSSEFKKQMLFLKHSGYTFITVPEVEAIIQGKRAIAKKSVVLTIDDGYQNILQLESFLANQHITPTVFLLSQPKKANRKEMDTHDQLVSNTEILQMKKMNWIIGSHSATHANLATVSKSDLYKEIIDSKRDLEKLLKQKISYFAYPRGKYTPLVTHIVQKAGYTLGLTMDDGVITTDSDTLRVPRIGVDRTHTQFEFRMIYSPSVVLFRQFIKSTPIGDML